MSDLARQVVSGFGPQWVAAEVGKLYPNDITHVRLNVRGGRADGILANPQWVLHEGDWVLCLGPHPTNRLYLIIGYLGSVHLGTWFEASDDVPDLTLGNGPIPGFRPPIFTAGDTLWRDLGANTGVETVRGHRLQPRPGTETDPAVAERVGVQVGELLETPTPTYGPFVVNGERLMIRDDIGYLPPPGPYCLTGDQGSTNGPAASYKAESMLGKRAWVGAPWQIVNGACGAVVAQTVEGATMIGGDGDSFTVTLKWTGGETGKPLLRLKLSALHPTHFEVTSQGGRSFTVTIDTTLFGGAPMQSSPGVGVPRTLSKEIRDENGDVIEVRTFAYFEATITYTKLPPPDPEDPAYPPLSSQVTGNVGYLFEGGQMAGGEPVNTMLPFMGGFRGSLVGGTVIGETTYTFIEPGPYPPLRAKRGEAFWHYHPHAGEQLNIPGLGLVTVGDPDEFDLLPTGWYFAVKDNVIVNSTGQSFALNSDDGSPLPDWMQGTPQHPDLGDLGGLDEDVLTQYPTVARILDFLEEAGITADDVPPTASRGYVTPSDRAAWDAAARTGGGLGAPGTDTGGVAGVENLTAAVDGATRVFSTAVPFVAGSLRVTLNSTQLRNGKDFRENATSTGFQIDSRTPSATSPKDVVRVAYTPAS